MSSFEERYPSDWQAKVAEAFDVSSKVLDDAEEIRRINGQRLHDAWEEFAHAFEGFEAALTAVIGDDLLVKFDTQPAETSFFERHFRTTEPAEVARLTCSQDPDNPCELCEPEPMPPPHTLNSDEAWREAFE